MWDYFKQVMQDADNRPSSKRWIALVCFLMVIATWAANLFYAKEIAEFIYNSLIYIVVGSLGITGVEKFAPRAPSDDDK